MKNLILIIAMLLAFSAAKSEKCDLYFPQEPGTSLVYHNYDEDGDLTSITVYKITGKEKTADGLKISVELKMYEDEDMDEEDAIVSNMVFYCKDGNFYWDMKAFVNSQSFESLRETDMEIKIDSDDLAFPSDLSVGQELPDGKITMSVKSMFMTMEFTTIIKDRKVEAKESVTTQAGTFNCYKISQITFVKAMMSETEMKSLSWTAENYGIIKSETYDEDGDLQSSMKLVEIKK